MNSIYKGGKAMQKWIILLIILIIVILGIVIVVNVNIETEYTPEMEIEDVELRKTIVSLYFKNNNSGEIEKETRLIDSKELLRDPYNFLIELLLTGPENSNYGKIIPENVKLIGTSFENGCVIINFSKEFEDNIQMEQLDKAIFSIFKTLTELTEVNSIKIIIDNNEVEGISNEINKKYYENTNIENNADNINVKNNTENNVENINVESHAVNTNIENSAENINVENNIGNAN